MHGLRDSNITMLTDFYPTNSAPNPWKFHDLAPFTQGGGEYPEAESSSTAGFRFIIRGLEDDQPTRFSLFSDAVCSKNVEPGSRDRFNLTVLCPCLYCDNSAIFAQTRRSLRKEQTNYYREQSSCFQKLSIFSVCQAATRRLLGYQLPGIQLPTVSVFIVICGLLHTSVSTVEFYYMTIKTPVRLRIWGIYNSDRYEAVKYYSLDGETIFFKFFLFLKWDVRWKFVLNKIHLIVIIEFYLLIFNIPVLTISIKS